MNANNRGYCKVLLRGEEIDFFGRLIGEHGSLDNVNRAYMWRILWSHVQSGDLKIDKFVSMIEQTIRVESSEEIVLFLLDKLSYCIKMGFLYKG